MRCTLTAFSFWATLSFSAAALASAAFLLAARSRATFSAFSFVAFSCNGQEKRHTAAFRTVSACDGSSLLASSLHVPKRLLIDVQ
jgi:hypothetical protein